MCIRDRVYANLPDDINLLLDDLWVQVKTGGSGSAALLIVVLAAFVVLYIAVVVVKKVKSKREFT